MRNAIIFLTILVIAGLFRFTGVNWDNGAHLHPDERFLTMVDTDIAWPATLAQYFDTANSPLNPQNRGHNFYVYGTWPVVLTKFIAEQFDSDTYGGVLIVGRVMSGIFDMLTVILVFLIANYCTKNIRAALLAMFIYAISVLPIQLSHFFAVDTFTIFAMTLTIYILIKKQLGILLGLALGLALGGKISSVLLLPAIGITYITSLKKKPFAVIMSGILMLVIAYGTLRIVYPYLFHGIGLNPNVIQNWKELKAFDGDNTGFPPALQWIGTKPLLYPLSDMMVWSLGIPLGILAIMAFLYALSHLKQRYILIIWICTVFFYQGFQFAKPLRYMAPIYPALSVLTGIFLYQSYVYFKKNLPYWLIGLFVYLFICLLLIWPLAFVAIYTRPTTRIVASQWMYDHIPPGKNLSWEQWDDPLPLGLKDHQISEYSTFSLSMYDPDTQENLSAKWQKLTGILAQTDYLILSSNRVYGGTQRAKKRYPTTHAYYQMLFSGTLGFHKIQEFTSRPTIKTPFTLCLLPPGARYSQVAIHSYACDTPGISIIDDFAEESFTVYDHPKVIIFENTKHLSQQQLLSLILP